ncbi:branched-chain amino acid ABC transporter permease [Falsiroseomonas sp. HW251]|uniref:branched-chain amino acid ABC transporter permease n=1 Tax=Falsiroseomonas sp. HW251 TaxID=3390998 RepID=UPI003D322ED5
MLAFAEQAVNGLMMGSIYVFVALGMMLIYGVMHVLNFAHGALFMLGAYVAQTVFTKVIGNYPLSVLTAGLFLVLVGAGLERGVFAPLRGNLRNQVIASLGLVLVIQNAVVAIFGPNALQFPVQATRATVHLGPLAFAVQHLLIIAVGFACVAALFAFLQRTKLGTALRAVSQNPRGALVVGIDVEATHRIAFALSMALAAIGGALLGPLFLVFPGMGDLPLVKGLAGIVLGGMGSIPGAVIGGLAIGVIEATSTLVLPTDWKDVVVFAIIVVVLLVRPQGLFGQRVRDEH